MANGAIKITWRDRNWAEHGHYIYRSDTPMNVNNLPSPISTVGVNDFEYIDYDVIADQTYYYRIGAFRNSDVSVSDEIEVIAAPLLYGPGPQTLIAGDMADGFFGEVQSSELFTGDELASIIQLSDGISQNSTEPWLKFSIDEKIVYIAKKTYRHTISWNAINTANAVYASQNNIVNKGDDNFVVRLMTGGHADPVTRDYNSVTSNAGEGSEWNRLLYRVHVDVPDGTSTYDGGPQIGDNWAEYTDEELHMGSGNYGYASWTQETPSQDTTRRITRGGAGIHRINANPFSGYSSIWNGWRPVLELIR